MSGDIDWEALLKADGMPADLPDENEGWRRVDLGDGLGRKTDAEELDENESGKHSKMCPINLGHRLDGELDQPDDRPVEALIK